MLCVCVGGGVLVLARRRGGGCVRGFYEWKTGVERVVLWSMLPYDERAVKSIHRVQQLEVHMLMQVGVWGGVGGGGGGAGACVPVGGGGGCSASGWGWGDVGWRQEERGLYGVQKSGRASCRWAEWVV